VVARRGLGRQRAAPPDKLDQQELEALEHSTIEAQVDWMSS